jgi:predicted nucleic acid-binding protein
MGFVSSLSGSSLYIDTNIFIYAFEGFLEYADRLRELFEAIDSGDVKAVTSELTLAELLVKPFMDANTQRQSFYCDTIQNSDLLSVCPVSRDILIDAARLRSESSLRLPDAIHVATASSAGCRFFLTNDRRITSVMGIQVIILSEA